MERNLLCFTHYTKKWGEGFLTCFLTCLGCGNIALNEWHKSRPRTFNICIHIIFVHAINMFNMIIKKLVKYLGVFPKNSYFQSFFFFYFVRVLIYLNVKSVYPLCGLWQSIYELWPPLGKVTTCIKSLYVMHYVFIHIYNCIEEWKVGVILMSAWMDHFPTNWT